MNKIKIFGAGSIGNHMANAGRALGASVDVVDIDSKALERMKNEIYPGRYGHWDKEINLYEKDFDTKEPYDLVIIGTPPNIHIELAISALSSSPKGF